VTFAEFVARIGRDERIVVLHDFDADGVTAGVVLQRALERAGFSDIVRVIPDRQRRASVAAFDPRALFVLDLGTQMETNGAAACIIDHHRPEGVPEGALLITGYERDPIPNTSLMTYELCAEIADVRDLDWIAAIGVLSDLGERAPFPLIAEVRERYSMKDLKEATALVNAARRASDYRPDIAARTLLGHDTPRELVQSTSDDVAWLREARAEVQREMAEAKKAAPKFAGNVALIRVTSKCQVHPVIAQIWRTRLPKYIVMVANDGYVTGRVNFSMRSAANVNLLDFLGAIDLGEGDGSYAHGHDQATGGSLPLEQWERLLAKLGF
jgi:single-stranded DNA-specific DHH superfamily exonuclease